MNMGLVLVVMAMLCAGAAAQSSCTNVLVSLSPCLNYITGNSSTPSSGCCSNLASVVNSQPLCLCQVLGGGASSLGISINQTQALALPGACKVKTPPTSQCNTKNGKRIKFLWNMRNEYRSLRYIYIHYANTYHYSNIRTTNRNNKKTFILPLPILN
jgi:hypothetical protein